MAIEGARLVAPLAGRAPVQTEASCPVINCTPAAAQTCPVVDVCPRIPEVEVPPCPACPSCPPVEALSTSVLAAGGVGLAALHLACSWLASCVLARRQDGRIPPRRGRGMVVGVGAW